MTDVALKMMWWRNTEIDIQNGLKFSKSEIERWKKEGIEIINYISNSVLNGGK